MRPSLSVLPCGSPTKFCTKQNTRPAGTFNHVLHKTDGYHVWRRFKIPTSDCTKPEKHEVIAALINRLNLDDGIELHEVSPHVPVWMRVAPAVDGRLPSMAEGKWRWVRLDTITAVIPEVGIGVSDDPGQKYHATAMRFRGSLVKAPIERLLRVVGKAVVNARHD